jgi:hypothetical protein
VTNAMALNSMRLLRKSVPTILKCRNFGGNESEREGAGLACDADQNECTLMPKMMGFELSLNEDCVQRETTGVFGHDPDNLHKQHRAELKEMASRYLACWK